MKSMKKFAAFMSIMLVLSMMFTMAVSAAPNGAGFDPAKTGTLALYKYTPNPDKTATSVDKDTQDPVSGAEFTAYQVVDLSGATYKLATPLADLYNQILLLEDESDEVQQTSKYYSYEAEVKAQIKAMKTTLTSLKNLLEADELKGAQQPDGSIGGATYSSTTEFEKLIPGLKTIVAFLESENEISSGNGLYKSTEDTEYESGCFDDDGEELLGGKYTFGDMNLGIYLVVETKVPEGFTANSQPFLVSIPEYDAKKAEWNYDITAYPKNDPLNLEKEVDDAIHAVGDTVKFTVTADVPNYGDNTLTAADFVADFRYFFADKMSEGLDFDPTSIKVQIADPSAPTTFTDVASTNYTVTSPFIDSDDADEALIAANAERDFVLEFDADYILSQCQGKIIKITYSATLNEKALVMGSTPNVNNVELFYSNSPDSSTLPDPLEDDEKVYTFEMDLDKKFNDKSAEAAGKNASGVEFSLKNKDGNKMFFITQASEVEGKWVSTKTGKYVAYTPEMTAIYFDTNNDDTLEKLSAGQYIEDGQVKTVTGKDDANYSISALVPAEEGVHVKINGVDYIITQKLNPASNGKLNVKGLDEGTYTLTEENSIEGYSKLATPVTIIVESDKDSNGNITGSVKAKATTQSPTEGSYDGKTEDLTTDLGKFMVSVNNVSKQFDLPQTGGAGLLMFTIAGGIVMALSVMIFSQLRKKKAAK
ncbi:MAG: SpaH/EbpB family LPXTG-anchored major pilin [Ruminococcus sp.]|nr:SpaH/EbpB family LPXTG-anchored major pilin [Ruminococcus sp.]